jgi:hypothetical protein
MLRGQNEGAHMKVLLRILAIVACLYLIVQTVRHTYMLWLEPRTSVLDKYDKPLKDEIAAAASVHELLRRYDVVRKEADRVKAERRAAEPGAQFDQESEPFKSESALRQAISGWEERAKEVRALRFYWFVGLLFAVLGVTCYLWRNRWLGVTLAIVGFSEIIYWTSPTFLGPTREFDRLLLNKLVFSMASLVLLGLGIYLLGVFSEEK